MKKISIYETLKEVNMFSSLEPEELKSLENISHVYEYDEGATLFLEGDVNASLILLVDGVVSVFKHDSKGNEIVIGYFNRYSLLAEAATLRHTPLPSTARFQTNGAVIKIDLEAFESLFMSNSKISYELIQSLLKKVELLQQNIHFNIASTAGEKILHFYTQNSTLSLDLKQYEIASVLGMTAETFSRNAAKLVKEGKLVKITTGFKTAS